MLKIREHAKNLQMQFRLSIFNLLLIWLANIFTIMHMNTKIFKAVPKRKLESNFAS